MDARTLVDVAIDEDPRAPCLWCATASWIRAWKLKEVIA